MNTRDEAKEWARKILAASNGQSITAISQHGAAWQLGNGANRPAMLVANAVPGRDHSTFVAGSGTS